MNVTRVLPLAVWLLLPLAAADARSDEGYIADKNGCKIANPNPKPSESVTWSGACKDGFADGDGIMQWYDQDKPGSRYEGTVVRGLLAGQGKLTLADGTTYDGGWLDGKQNGTGTLRAANGASYSGEWKNGMPDGRGVMRNASGDAVRGLFKQGNYVEPDKEKQERGPGELKLKVPAPQQ
jgi:hypothetical protein